MKLGRGDVLTWMQREALRVEPNDDGVGVREKQRSKSRRRKDKEAYSWSREAAGKPGMLLMETSMERAGGDPSQNESRWIALKQKAIQVEPLAEDFVDEKPRCRPREVPSPGDADGGQKRTRIRLGADKAIKTGGRSILRSLFGPPILTNMVRAHVVGGIYRSRGRILILYHSGLLA